MAALPSSRELLSTLLAELAAIPPAAPPPAAPTAPLSFTALPSALQTLLLTLHCLLPTVLLPALDILDRRQVVRVACATHSVYYVRSVGVLHEVRTGVWSCSCAAWAFDAASWGAADDGEGVAVGDEAGGGVDGGWGGLMRDGVKRGDAGSVAEGAGGVPVCKHLVACVLAEKCGMLGVLVERREVSVEEMAGMAVVWE